MSLEINLNLILYNQESLLLMNRRLINNDVLCFLWHLLYRPIFVHWVYMRSAFLSCCSLLAACGWQPLGAHGVHLSCNHLSVEIWVVEGCSARPLLIFHLPLPRHDIDSWIHLEANSTPVFLPRSCVWHNWGYRAMVIKGRSVDSGCRPLLFFKRRRSLSNSSVVIKSSHGITSYDRRSLATELWLALAFFLTFELVFKEHSLALRP